MVYHNERTVSHTAASMAVCKAKSHTVTYIQQ